VYNKRVGHSGTGGYKTKKIGLADYSKKLSDWSWFKRKMTNLKNRPSELLLEEAATNKEIDLSEKTVR